MFLTDRTGIQKENLNLLTGANEGNQRVKINGVELYAKADENILSAAIRQGFDFPHSCRVGGCATCKCQLVAGKVKELTETGYILSDEELDEGYILACQSIPKTDVEIRVTGKETITGKITNQKNLTHDICEITIQLERPLTYIAGQYVSLTIEGLNVERNYSIANPPNQKGIVTFIIRKVPDGKLSNYIFDYNLAGKSIKLKGAFGDFYLRDSKRPILMIAGGSGLAPILAILKQGILARTKRPLTLLFGAKTKEDLYKLKEIQKIGKEWKGKFTFIPILSDEPKKSSWKGQRGYVTNLIKEHINNTTEAYLCGPPPMVDTAKKELVQCGISKRSIYADRFTTIDHSLSLNIDDQNSRSAAKIFDYLKFFLFHAVAISSMISLLLGGSYTTFGFFSLLFFYIIGDAFSGDDKDTPNYTKPEVLTLQLWMALPILCLIFFCSVWTVSPTDTFGFGSWLTQTFGFDFNLAKENTSSIVHVYAIFLTGLMIGLVGTITAHELTHRTWDAISMFIGRWLLAFSFDTIFSIEHVYGHHRYVSTTEDPATAPRGRNVYYHILASTIKGNISAWKIEVKRLKRKNVSIFSYHNAFIRGHLMSVCLVLLSYLIGGIPGMLFFITSGLFGKSLLEIVNYMEHYGMVRMPEEPVQPRHSWNTNKRISSWTMFNLTRHSHHHAQGEVPYQNLRPYPNAPMMISGYLTTIVIALIPPLWHHLMTPKVLEWDRKFASQEELELARIANENSGIAKFKSTNTN
ncbi:flavodoxin reductase [Leptospira bouyouniensis]|uniref:Flavodoxin reductase n=1 Tax=Leptospira bouyouniensis TaxID=2484911 RepID=A0A7I0HSY2_9LEPT|nr:fatty acid desaturase [Leptospira bouyouniensis]TGL06686.1 flavodoxin reductase [Leptospira bouyouniensis]